jgi:septal ring factor EnvC (AmiA/AmiB activator)
MEGKQFLYPPLLKGCACCPYVCGLVLDWAFLLLLQVAPKRAALAAAQATLDATLTELASAQSRLAAVQDKIAALEAQFEEATAKKAALAAQVNQQTIQTPAGCNTMLTFPLLPFSEV